MVACSIVKVLMGPYWVCMQHREQGKLPQLCRTQQSEQIRYQQRLPQLRGEAEIWWLADIMTCVVTRLFVCVCLQIWCSNQPEYADLPWMCSSKWICERWLKLMQQLCGSSTDLLVWQLLPHSGDHWFNRPFTSFVKTREEYDRIPAFLEEESKKNPDAFLLLYLKKQKKGSDYIWKGFLFLFFSPRRFGQESSEHP